MSKRTYHLHDGKKGAAMAVRITPRASRNEIVEIQSDGTVKIHLHNVYEKLGVDGRLELMLHAQRQGLV